LCLRPTGTRKSVTILRRISKKLTALDQYTVSEISVHFSAYSEIITSFDTFCIASTGGRCFSMFMYRVDKKVSRRSLQITSSNTGRFSNLFHYRILQEICNKSIINPTSPREFLHVLRGALNLQGIEFARKWGGNCKERNIQGKAPQFASV